MAEVVSDDVVHDAAPEGALVLPGQLVIPLAEIVRQDDPAGCGEVSLRLLLRYLRQQLLPVGEEFSLVDQPVHIEVLKALHLRHDRSLVRAALFLCLRSLQLRRDFLQLGGNIIKQECFNNRFPQLNGVGALPIKVVIITAVSISFLMVKVKLI